MAIWDIDPQDYADFNLKRKEDIFSSYLSKETATPPTSAHMSLMHDVHAQTGPHLLPWVIQQVRAKGYRFATVAECLNDPRPYQ